jgi:hypothetical protein
MSSGAGSTRKAAAPPEHPPPTFAGPGRNVISSNEVDLLEAVYLNVTTPSDKSTKAGLWPDPLIPVGGPNHPPAETEQPPRHLKRRGVPRV